MIINRRLRRDFDRPILFIVSMIALAGLLAIYSATQVRDLPFNESYILRQMTWVLIGAAAFLLALNVSYQKFIDFSYFIYAVNIILLLLVLALGRARLGAQRWFTIGSFTFQPSEFMKLSLILVLANYIGSRRGSMASAGNLMTPLLLVMIPVGLVLVQPDLGTAFIMIPVFFAMLLAGGADIRHLAGMVLAALAGLPFLWGFLHDYQRQRLLVFVNPNIDPLGAGYTIIQSKIAVGSGGLFGKGWLAGTQNQLNFLPERHTDFIFSVIGEEWGFLGAAVLVLLYLALVKRGLAVASSTNDMYGRLVATGTATMIAFEAAVNIGMTIGLMPVVGIPLPLVSYGGSSVLATFIAIGMLMNVGMRRAIF